MEQTVSSLDKSLSLLIDGATEKGPKLVELLYTQAPDVINQLLMWHGAKSFIQFLIAVFLLFVVPFIIWATIKKLYKIAVAEYGNKWDDAVMFWLPTAIMLIIYVLPIQIGSWNMINLTWLQIWIAPKVYLLEYLSNLIK